MFFETGMKIFTVKAHMTGMRISQTRKGNKDVSPSSLSKKDIELKATGVLTIVYAIIGSIAVSQK